MPVEGSVGWSVDRMVGQGDGWCACRVKLAKFEIHWGRIDSFDLGRVGVAKVFDFMKFVNTFPIVCSIYIVTAHMYAHPEHCVE